MVYSWPILTLCTEFCIHLPIRSDEVNIFREPRPRAAASANRDALFMLRDPICLTTAVVLLNNATVIALLGS